MDARATMVRPPDADSPGRGGTTWDNQGVRFQHRALLGGLGQRRAAAGRVSLRDAGPAHGLNRGAWSASDLPALSGFRAGLACAVSPGLPVRVGGGRSGRLAGCARLLLRSPGRTRRRRTVYGDAGQRASLPVPTFMPGIFGASRISCSGGTSTTCPSQPYSAIAITPCSAFATG